MKEGFSYTYSHIQELVVLYLKNAYLVIASTAIMNDIHITLPPYIYNITFTFKLASKLRTRILVYMITPIMSTMITPIVPTNQPYTLPPEQVLYTIISSCSIFFCRHRHDEYRTQTIYTLSPIHTYYYYYYYYSPIIARDSQLHYTAILQAT